jgi:hypothetical protein
MTMTANALMYLHAGKTAPGIELARDVAGEIARPDFDMEAATNVLSLWVRLAPFGIDDTEFCTVVQQLTRRFSVSKMAMEVLVAAVQRKELPAGWIREAHAQVMQLAEQAMNHAVRGQPKAAVETLLQHGQHTGNAKLIEMAGLVANRHRERIEGVDALLTSAGQLSHRYCSPSTHIAGVRRSNRSAGGMVLRR